MIISFFLDHSLGKNDLLHFEGDRPKQPLGQNLGKG